MDPERRPRPGLIPPRQAENAGISLMIIGILALFLLPRPWAGWVGIPSAIAGLMLTISAQIP